jgi:hypothetical protein
MNIKIYTSLLIFCLLTSILAENIVYISAKPSLNIRETASTNSKIIGKLSYGSTVNFIEKSNKRETINNLSNNWYKIRYNSTSGWVFGAYLCNKSTFDLLGSYKWTYSHNTKNLKEDHYLVLLNNGNKLYGLYFGTTDDFDEAREGYLPGFYLSEINNIIINDKNIEFNVTLNSNNIFTEEIPRGTISVNQIKLDKWDTVINFDRTKIYYKGKIESNRLMLIIDGNERIFIKE